MQCAAAGDSSVDRIQLDSFLESAVEVIECL